MHCNEMTQFTPTTPEQMKQLPAGNYGHEELDRLCQRIGAQRGERTPLATIGESIVYNLTAEQLTALLNIRCAECPGDCA